MPDILTEYKSYLKFKQSSNLESKLFSVRQLISYLQEQGLDQLTISQAVAEEYKIYLSTFKIDDQYYQRGTINNKLSMLKSFYDYLQKKGIVFHNPFRAISHVKVHDHLPRNILSEQEIETLFSSIELTRANDVLFYLCCELLYSLGIRISELCRVRFSDLQPLKKVIKIHDSKSKRERLIPINDFCLNLIDLYRESIRPYLKSIQPDYIFPQNHGQTTLRCFLNRRLSLQTQKCGIKKKVTSHCFRHSMASALFKNGAKIREVQSLLGHERIRTTEIYTRVAREDLKEVVRCTHPRECYFKGKSHEIKL